MNQPRPLVSVIMPAHNTARYIEDAIDSVLEQGYRPLELIVIDDGSTDGTVELLQRYGNRIRLITQSNKGAGAARNQGLQAAQGEFIAFLDSDDLWLPGKVAAQVTHLQLNPDIGLVFSRWGRWEPDQMGDFTLPERDEQATDTPPGVVPERSGWLYNRLLFGSALHTITVMMRRSLVQQVGLFDTGLKRGQDYDYWIRASRHTQIHQLDRVFALYRLHGEGCIKKWPAENFERIVVQKALDTWGLSGPDGKITAISDIRKRLADTSFSFGYHHFWEGDPRIAFRAFVESTRDHPARIAHWRYLILSALKLALQRSAPAHGRDPKPLN